MHKAAAALLLLLLSPSPLLCTAEGGSDLAEDGGQEKPPVWFTGAPEMQELAQLSWEYVHDMQCWLWPDKCEEEPKQQHADWSWNFGWGSLDVLSELYSKVAAFTDPTQRTVTNNLTGLEWDLEKRLHGQHLAVKQILSSIKRFLQEEKPEKSLVLSLHGWTGTGKNFAARIIADNLYQDGLRNRCTKVFIPQLHFPHQSHVNAYKVQLEKQIREISSRCAQHLFIFDEADKLPATLLDPLLHLLSPTEDHGTRGIFLFLSGIGSHAINEVTLNFWRAGRYREEITADDVDRPLQAAIQQSDDQLLPWRLLSEGHISDFVPFLPLERSHIKQCARDVYGARGLPYTDSSLDRVLHELTFVPKDEQIFSAQGCKHVAQRIHFMKP